MILLLRLRPARRSAVTTTASSSASRLLGMRPLSSLMLSRGRTRTLLMRSRISLTSLVMVEDPSMSLTSSAVVWRLRRKSSRLLWKRLRLPLSKKKTRSSEPSLSLAKSGKRLTARFRRRKKSSTTQGTTLLKQFFSFFRMSSQSIYFRRAGYLEKYFTLSWGFLFQQSDLNPGWEVGGYKATAVLYHLSE